MGQTPRRQREYKPERLVGDSVETLRAEVQRELDMLSLVLGELTNLDLLPQGAEPQKFKEGTIRFFLPGISVTGIAVTEGGLHQFRDGAWRRLRDM